MTGLSGAIGPDIETALTDTLASVRMDLLREMAHGAPDDPLVFQTLIRSMHSDPHAVVREHAAGLGDVVAGVDRERMIMALIQVFQNDLHGGSRWAAAQTLGRIAPSDPRVVDLLATIKNRGSFGHPTARTAQVTILPFSGSIRADGLGPYRDGEESVYAYYANGYGLVVWNNVHNLTNQPRPELPPTPKVRSLTYDLSKPVPGSGAVSRGIVVDSMARFSGFWRHTEAGGVPYYAAPEEAGPVGTSVESERVDIWIRIGGDQYLLHMGSWGMGLLSPRGRVVGEGTSAAKITRVAEDRWRWEAPEGSIARLWNVNDIQNPTAVGLYYFSFALEFERIDP